MNSGIPTYTYLHNALRRIESFKLFEYKCDAFQDNYTRPHYPSYKTTIEKVLTEIPEDERPGQHQLALVSC